MNNREKALVVGAIDDFLKESLNYHDMLSDEQYDRVNDYLCEVVDTSSPKDIRESLVALGRRLYSELFKEPNDQEIQD